MPLCLSISLPYEGLINPTKFGGFSIYRSFFHILDVVPIFAIIHYFLGLTSKMEYFCTHNSVCKVKPYFGDMQIKRNKSYVFRDFIANLKVSQLSSFRKEVVAQCKVSAVAYYKWARGAAVPTAPHQHMINKIAVKYGYKEIYRET